MRRRIAGASFLAAAALVTSFFVSPAAARPSPGHATEAECVERGPFNTLQRLTKSASWRVRDPHHLLEKPTVRAEARTPARRH